MEAQNSHNIVSFVSYWPKQVRSPAVSSSGKIDFASLDKRVAKSH